MDQAIERKEATASLSATIGTGCRYYQCLPQFYWEWNDFSLWEIIAKAIENGAGSITTECKGFDFSITLGDDFKIATDKETQKEIIEIKLQGS